MSEEGYNGWTNYETWLLALNVDNDQGLYNSTRDLIKQTKSMDGMRQGSLNSNWRTLPTMKNAIPIKYATTGHSGTGTKSISMK